ncbi:Serine/threonine protein kinase [Dispira simplex]|nr:Serine/threonine protein kinase [Dispira simplex]
MDYSTPPTSGGALLGHTLGQGRYKLIDLIGVGTYGEVYLTRDQLRGTLYATKCILKANFDTKTCSYSIEIALQRILPPHRNIARLYLVEHWQEYVFMVIEYCPGGDLYDNIVNNPVFKGPRHNAVVRRIFFQLLDAVEHCHRNGIYHRDLKPENVLIKDDGQVIKLIDFGLATDSPCSSDIGCGSSYYMSPECQGGLDGLCASYDTAANDVWSLGVILVNLASGRNPWNQAIMSDPIFRAFVNNPDFLSSALPITPQFNRIIKLVFCLDPTERCTLDELRRLVKGCRYFMRPPGSTAPTTAINKYPVSEDDDSPFPYYVHKPSVHHYHHHYRSPYSKDATKQRGDYAVVQHAHPPTTTSSSDMSIDTDPRHMDSMEEEEVTVIGAAVPITVSSKERIIAQISAGVYPNLLAHVDEEIGHGGVFAFSPPSAHSGVVIPSSQSTRGGMAKSQTPLFEYTEEDPDDTFSSSLASTVYLERGDSLVVATKATTVPKATTTKEEEALDNTLANFSIPLDDFVLVTKSDLESPSSEEDTSLVAHSNRPGTGERVHPPNSKDRKNEAAVVTIPSMWMGVSHEARPNLPRGEQHQSDKGGGGAVTKSLTLSTHTAMNSPDPASTVVLGLDDPTDYSFCSLKTPVNNITFDGMMHYASPTEYSTKAAASGGSHRHTTTLTSSSPPPSAPLLKSGEEGAFSSYPLHIHIPITVENMGPSSPTDRKSIPYFVSSSTASETSVDVTISDPTVNNGGPFCHHLQSEFVIY